MSVPNCGFPAAKERVPSIEVVRPGIPRYVVEVLEIALAKGKRKYDKRKAIADRDAQRDVERALKDRRQGRSTGARTKL